MSYYGDGTAAQSVLDSLRWHEDTRTRDEIAAALARVLADMLSGELRLGKDAT